MDAILQGYKASSSAEDSVPRIFVIYTLSRNFLVNSSVSCGWMVSEFWLHGSSAWSSVFDLRK